MIIGSHLLTHNPCKNWCLLTFSFLLVLLVYLFHSIGVPWPFKMMPLPHSDSTPSLAFGLVTDAERSFDIVPVSQSVVAYLSHLFNPFTYYSLHLACSLIQYMAREDLHFQTGNTNKWHCFMRPVWSLLSPPLQLHLGKWLEITGTRWEGETSRVVTVRVVSKGGWCTAGEIDSYLDENEAWCLWGERRAAFASKWTEVSQKRSSITNNKNIKS